MPRLPLHLLLVDDNPADLLLTELAFEAHALPARFTTAQSGPEALALLRTITPDLILLDLKMPGMNGLDVLQVLKAHPQLRRVPVLMFTTSALEGDVLASYDRHANSYLQKPTRLEDYGPLIQALQHFWTERALLPSQD